MDCCCYCIHFFPHFYFFLPYPHVKVNISHVTYCSRYLVLTIQLMQLKIAGTVNTCARALYKGSRLSFSVYIGVTPNISHQHFATLLSFSSNQNNSGFMLCNLTNVSAGFQIKKTAVQLREIYFNHLLGHRINTLCLPQSH